MAIDEQFISERRGVTATIKYGSGFEQPWLVFHGSVAEVYKDIEAAFNLERPGSLHDLVLAASEKAHTEAPASEQKSYGKQWPGKGKPKAEAAEEVHPFNDVLAQIELAKSVDDLKRIWVNNKEAFDHPDVEAARAERAASFAPAGSHEEAVQNAAEALGASVVEETVEEAQEPAQAPQEASQEPASPNAGLIVQIGAAPTKAALGRLWVQHRKAFEDPEVEAARKARLEELSK